VEAHYHEFHKLLLLCSGSGGYMVAGCHYALQPGDIVLVGRHTVHRPEFQPGSPYERIIIYIAPDFLAGLNRAGWDLETVFSRTEGHVIRLPEKERRRLFSLAAQLEQELSGQNFGREILGSALLQCLLVELGRARQNRTLEQPARQEDSRVAEILRYIDAHLAEDISIDTLSEVFFVSKYHMMRQFRRETGQSIHSYLTDRRILRARELMAAGMSATESCFRAGFGSYCAFTLVQSSAKSFLMSAS
jgi:AraC-like DNA-binding protein